MELGEDSAALHSDSHIRSQGAAQGAAQRKQRNNAFHHCAMQHRRGRGRERGKREREKRVSGEGNKRVLFTASESRATEARLEK